MTIQHTSLNWLSEKYPGWVFDTQAHIYQGLAAVLSEQGRFEELEFVNQIIDPIFFDANDLMSVKDTSQLPDFFPWPKMWSNVGNVFEGHIDTWHRGPKKPGDIYITGYHSFDVTDTQITLGFDYWDWSITQTFNVPLYWHEITRNGIDSAIYDIGILTGNHRPHRIEFLQQAVSGLDKLQVLTDQHQTWFDTSLRMQDLGMEVWLNKIDMDRFQNYKAVPDCFLGQNWIQLPLLPHKKFYESCRVHVVLETTARSAKRAYLTEKTFKVLANHRPFVIFGDTNALQRLHEKGFRTFGEFCDESYDSESDLDKRIAKVQTAACQLAQACNTASADIDEICAWNQQHFFNPKRINRELIDFGHQCQAHIYA
jgi:hypothetical protein